MVANTFCFYPKHLHNFFVSSLLSKITSRMNKCDSKLLHSLQQHSLQKMNFVSFLILFSLLSRFEQKIIHWRVVFNLFSVGEMKLSNVFQIILIWDVKRCSSSSYFYNWIFLNCSQYSATIQWIDTNITEGIISIIIHERLAILQNSILPRYTQNKPDLHDSHLSSDKDGKWLKSHTLASSELITQTLTLFQAIICPRTIY